nr:helix-turn-helix domain-containing protein [Rhodococcus trifolii]
MESRWCVPVRHAHHLIGLMLVIDASQSLTKAEKTRIEAAAAQIGAALYADTDDDRPDSSFEVDLDGVLDSDEDVRRTAVGNMPGGTWLTTDSEMRCFAIRVVASAVGGGFIAPHRALRAALGTRQGVAPQHYVFSATDEGARLIEKVAPAGRSGPAQHSVDAMLSVANALLGGDGMCVVGVGDPVLGLSAAWRSYRQASIAADAAARTSRFGSVVEWSELGAYSVLLQNPKPGEAFILPSTLAALEDPGQPSWMRETLLAFLDSSGSGPRAADALHIHRTTLYYRMDRIREAIEMDLDDGENRLLLHAALRMLELDR